MQCILGCQGFGEGGKRLGNPRHPKEEIFVTHPLILQLSIRPKVNSQFVSWFPRDSEKLQSILWLEDRVQKGGECLSHAAVPTAERTARNILMIC